MGKSAGEMVAEANAAIETMSIEEAKALVSGDDVVFLDVREDAEVAKGKIPGAVHVSRGLLEFVADPNSPMHKPELSSGKPVVVYCASGGRSALAGKVLKDMGVDRVTNMLGGFNAWREAGF
ncbi:MAG: rhodanese-like domain-containing protein, partial [Geminicoccaceae bacterium]